MLRRVAYAYVLCVRSSTWTASLSSPATATTATTAATATTTTWRHGSSVAGTFYAESDMAAVHTSSDTDVHLGVQLQPHTTLVDVWSQAQRAWPRRRFLGAKMWVRGRLGYLWSTYETMDKEVAAMRVLLHGMHVDRGTRVVVVSENRYEWFVVHMATLQLGAQFVPLPTSVTPSEAQAVVCSTHAKVLFVESTTTLATVRGWCGTVGGLEHVVCFDDAESEASYGAAITLAASVQREVAVRSDVRVDDTALIAFTCGTTGPPKGVVLSHRTLVANLSALLEGTGAVLTQADMTMSLCSWCVAGALTMELYLVMCRGACICIPPELLEGYADLPLVNPSVLVTTARPIANAVANIHDDVLHRRRFTGSLARAALGELARRRALVQRPPRVTRFVADMLLGKYKSGFGSQLRVVVVIGSALTRLQHELLADLDVFVLGTYGCLEAGGIVATDLDVPQRLKALPGVDVRVVNARNEIVAPGDVGEVLVEAPHAMLGYFDVHMTPSEARHALIEYGSRTFVRTGDYGSVTGTWLSIKGHKGVLVTLDDGDTRRGDGEDSSSSSSSSSSNTSSARATTIDPTELELELTQGSFIHQAFVYGHGRPYLTALIVPNTAAIAAHLRRVQQRDGVPIVTEREKADCVRAELRRLCAALPPRAHVRRFALVDEFTLANGFLTAKLGYARRRIEAHYVHYLDALYDETPKFYGYAVDDYDDLF